MSFADPKNDLAFKKIFANEAHKEVLISFLNAVLDFKDNKSIVDIRFTDPYQLPDIPELKQTILDIKAKNVNGEEFIVEMQNKYVKSFTKRSLYYAANAYVSQMNKGTDYSQLNKVYFIGILNFSLFEDNKDYISRHLILDSKTYKQHIKNMEFCFIELKKFDKKLEDLDNIVDKWIYFLKTANYLDNIPGNLEQVQAIKSAFDIASQHTWSARERDIYIELQQKQWSEIITLEEAIQKAEQRGFDKGLKQLEQARAEAIDEGEKQKTLEIAKKLLLQGLDQDTIIKATGLSAKTIQDLKS